MTSPSSLISIQKPKTKTKNVLPKASLIQVYIDNQSKVSFNNSNNKQSIINSLNVGNSSPINSNKNKVLPKFNNNDIVKHLNLITSVPVSDSSTSTAVNVPTQTLAQIKKSFKEKRFKEFTRICLNQENQSHHEFNNSSKKQNEQNDLNTDGSIIENKSDFNNRKNIVSHLAKEFLLDCKQRLDLNSYKILLNHLNEYNNKKGQCNTNEILDNIFELIKKDKNLCTKFSGFLTCENSMKYDLFMQTQQYEKSLEFLNKLELFIPNKLAFKKLLQTFIASSNNVALEKETISSKIEEIKAKIKQIFKNNAFINMELDYLFDQRHANLEPTYEKISLLEETNKEPNTISNDINIKIENEFIDLTNFTHSIDYGTKKCSCKCHQEVITNSNDQNDPAIQTNDEYQPSNTNHCLLCSLKLVKGKLCIKCEGKKAIPLIYKTF